MHCAAPRRGRDWDVLGDCQQVVPVHAFIFACFIVVFTYSASVDHGAPIWVGFWVEEVVTFRTKVKGGLKGRIARTSTRSRQPSRLWTRAGQTNHLD